MRKLRWGKGNRGKRSGYRAIYYFFTEECLIYLMAIYPKNQRVDLSPEQRKQLSTLAGELKAVARVDVEKRSVR